MLRSVVFATGGVVHLGLRPKSAGAGWRVRTAVSPQSAAMFAARCLTSGETLIAHVEDGVGKKRKVPICQSGRLARGARALLSLLLSDDEYRLLELYAVSRRTMYGKGGG